MKKFFTSSLSVTSFAIFVTGLYFLANIELFFAIGFGILLLIHELGHVLALQKLGKVAGGIYFLPFMGAFVTTKEEFHTENDYAYVKYLGPFMGTLGVLAILFAFLLTSDPKLLRLVFSGAVLNLINMIPLTFLDGYGVLKGVIKHVEWVGFLTLIILGFFVFNEYVLTLSFLLILTLFVDSSMKEETGYQLHEVVLSSVFILIMIFITITQKEFLIWNLAYTTLSIFLFCYYIYFTCFRRKQNEITQATYKLLPLNKKDKFSWGVRWILLTTVLWVISLYAYYLLE